MTYRLVITLKIEIKSLQDIECLKLPPYVKLLMEQDFIKSRSGYKSMVV